MYHNNDIENNALAMKVNMQQTSWYILLYRVSQEECEILQESVPYVKL